MKTLKVSRIFLGDFLNLKKKSCSILSLTSQSQVPLCYWQLGARGCIFIFTSSSFYRNCQSIKGNINNYENNGYLSLNFLLRGVLRWKKYFFISKKARGVWKNETVSPMGMASIYRLHTVHC